MNEPNRSPLDEALARLGREVAPRADLWPGIERRISARSSRALPLALAATLSAICIAAGATWAVLHERARLDQSLHARAGREALFDEPRDARYVSARRALEKTFAERVALLDPATRATIAVDLAQIRASRADLRRALAAHPDNPVLEQLLESSWHDEFDLYDDIITGTQPTLARNSP